jgi:hypothetical protein
MKFSVQYDPDFLKILPKPSVGMKKSVIYWPCGSLLKSEWLKKNYRLTRLPLNDSAKKASEEPECKNSMLFS